MTIFHLDTGLPLRDDIVSCMQPLGKPTAMGVPTVVLGADTHAEACRVRASMNRLKDPQ
jgi:hypothetical protein